MPRHDWILIALDAGSDAGLSPVQIQKAMFLFAEGAKAVLPADEFYRFEAYNYGPFCSQIYLDLERQAAEGLVTISRGIDAPGTRVYTITQAGHRRSMQLRLKHAKVANYIREIVAWVRSKSFSELVRAIYQKWPKYKANSVFVD